MKVIKSKNISAFGGINFVIEEFDKQGLGKLLKERLPVLGSQSLYDWREQIHHRFVIFTNPISKVFTGHQYRTTPISVNNLMNFFNSVKPLH